MELCEMKNAEKITRRNRRNNIRRDKAKRGSYANSFSVYRNRHNGKGAPSGCWVEEDNYQKKILMDYIVTDQLDSTSTEATPGQVRYALRKDFTPSEHFGTIVNGNFCMWGVRHREIHVA